MKLQFKKQDYQSAAVQAVVDVFRGQPQAQSLFENPLPTPQLGAQNQAGFALTEHGVANYCVLDDAQLLSNIQTVQVRYNQQLGGDTTQDVPNMPLLPVSTELVRMNPDDAFFNVSIEMETGTGKTYVFLSTIHALHKEYGFKKFIIAVPSVAIREGTLKNLAITEAHFFEEYQQRIEFKVYDSKNLSHLRQFSMSNNLQVLVMSIDAFTKDNNVINTLREQGIKPIEFIQHTRPIVIIDEPQNFETDIRRAAIANLNPLCTLRYSATHKNPYNLLYSLNPVQAYDLGLVKQIEVDGITVSGDNNDAQIELIGIDQAKRALKARVQVWVEGTTGVSKKEVALGLGDDLFDKSNRRAQYESGFVLTEIRYDDGEIEFSNGRVVVLGQGDNNTQDAVMKYQIERTVKAHFQRLKKLKPLGIKVLSLFFIDKVANYRSYDEQGNAVQGKFALWFEAAFAKYAAQYAGLIDAEISRVHNGYFSGEKTGKGKDKKEQWTDTKGSTAKDDDTYTLIMKDKERLLSLDEPLQFIFSHSALREGWDNPNVFQICTLNETKSEQKKRQEIGRGLRLPVNQAGERITDKKINVLTVIANESYETFSRALQAEIEDETGVKFTHRIADARAKARVRLRPHLSIEEQALFDELWNKINYQVHYSVVYDTQVLVDKAVALLGDSASYPKVSAPKLHVTKTQVLLTNEGVAGVEVGADSAQYQVQPYPIPDVYAFIQGKVNVTRSTIFAVLQQSGRLAELPINPQAFLDMVVDVLRIALRHVLVDGIVYARSEHQRYDMSLFDVSSDSYLSGLFPDQSGQCMALTHTPLEAIQVDDEGVEMGDAFACVQTDSQTERDFAQDCNMRKDAEDATVRFFLKLPKRFKIPTPAGNYVPDWAMVIDKNQSAAQRVYFVAETKSTLDADSLRGLEKLRILYAEKYFKQTEFSADSVLYRKVTNMDDVVQALTSAA
ncbi:MAG: DEAD/DEAH box helicase family protein [Sulfuriferula sp.]|nr:DEAD/DEAH box helicase family protein [Sulfuriferula sp.]